MHSGHCATVAWRRCGCRWSVGSPRLIAKEAVPVFLSYVVDLLQLRGVDVARKHAHPIPDGHEDVVTLALSWMDTLMDIEDWEAPFIATQLSCQGGEYEGARARPAWAGALRM
jgi:hypothetical protein